MKYLFAYIHLNPVKNVDPRWKSEDGMVAKWKVFLDTYPYSSYPEHTGNTRSESAILCTKEFPGFFNHPAEFEDFVEEWKRTSEEDVS